MTRPDQTTKLTIFGREYELGYSIDIHRQISKELETEFYHLMASVIDEINQINLAYGEPPKHISGDAYIKAMEEYSASLNMEMTKRITGLVSLEDAAKIFYIAAKPCNSMVELGEFEEAVWAEGIKPTDKKSGYQYLVSSYLTWCFLLDDDGEIDEKKSLGGSLFKGWVNAISNLMK